ncbi:MAG: hypothetical protein H3C27_02445 [Opitutaceae bacterium]|nr:hypothetical protein [Opitutaceae bacterium]
MHSSLKTVFLAAMLTTSLPAGAQIVIATSYVTGAAGWGTDTFVGQSITTPQDGSWNNISFTLLLSSGAKAPNVGDLYLLDQAFAGPVGTLSDSAPGYIAKSSGKTNGSWSFDNSVVLNPASTYYFYTQSPQNPFYYSYSYADGTAYKLFSNTAGSGYYQIQTDGMDTLFTLEGSAHSVVPEHASSSLLVAVTSLAITIFLVRRRNRSAAR